MNTPAQTKREFYKNLHEELGKKYSISPNVVSHIRPRVISGGFDRGSLYIHTQQELEKKATIIEQYNRALEKHREKNNPETVAHIESLISGNLHKKEVLNNVMEFLKHAPEDVYQDIIRKVSLDQNADGV